jgi:Viral BACON domain
VQEDGPPVPNQHWLGRKNAGERAPGGMPTWPEADAHRPRVIPSGGRSTPLVAGIIAVSLGANVALLAALLAVVLLARGGYFVPAPQPAAGTSATSTALSSSGPSPSAAPTAGWLQVGPTSVQLGCDGGQQAQFVVLANTGAQDVQWQVVYSVSADQAGVTISPRQGTLRAGNSIVVQVQSKRQSDGQQGIIHFDPDTSAAGTPPSLSYTTAGCS